MTDLSELIARLEKADGPDRELDRAIMALFYTRERRYIGCRCDPSCCPEGAHLDEVWVDPDTDRWRTTARDGFEFTASLDAALALVERVRPDLCVENLGEMSPDCGPLAGHWLAQLRPRKPRPRVTSLTPEAIRASLDAFEPVSAPTHALALLLALLRTYEADHD